MKLSVVIPCYNEVATIGELLRAVRAAPGGVAEVIVVDPETGLHIGGSDPRTDGGAEGPR